MFSSFPREPSIAGSKNDFVLFWSGTLELSQDNLINAHVKRQDVDVDQAAVLLKTAPIGSDAIFEFYVNAVLVATVTVADGDTYGESNFAAVTVNAGEVCEMKIVQVGSTVAGETATGYLRVAA